MRSASKRAASALLSRAHWLYAPTRRCTLPLMTAGVLSCNTSRTKSPCLPSLMSFATKQGGSDGDSELGITDSDDVLLQILDDEKEGIDEITAAIDPGDDVFDRNYVSGIVLVQPVIRQRRSGEVTKRDNDFSIEEAERLVEGLGGGGFEVVSTLKANGILGPRLFGKGVMTRLGDELAELHVNVADATAEKPPVNIVFVNVPVINASFKRKVSEIWQGYYILDRFGVILQIFKTRARSIESKIQVALAEIPYIRGQLVQGVAAGYDRQRGGIGVRGGAGETRVENRRRLLADREIALKRKLEKVRKHHGIIRENREKNNVPVVALVGYTNAGKSELLKRFVGTMIDDPDRPLSQDRLFHTLETTARRAKLPGNLDVIILDSIGFISDLPHGLVDAFRLTLADIQHATILVHVRDVAHPETKLQAQEVMKVLTEEMTLPEGLLENMVEVYNKIDLLEKAELPLPAVEGSRPIHISAKHGDGLEQLLESVSSSVLSAVGQKDLKVDIDMTDADQLAWMYKYGKVLDSKASNDGLKLHVKVRLTSEHVRQHASRYIET